MHLPTLKREDLEDRVLVGKCLMFFIKNDPFCKEINSKFMQNCAQNGLLHNFCKTFFKSEPKTTNLIPWFMDMVASDMLLNKNNSQEQWQKHIDMLSRFDITFLDQIFRLSKKYNIDTDSIKENPQNAFKILNKEDKATLTFAFFSDGILHSEIRILSYYFKQWFGVEYRVKQTIEMNYTN